MARKRQEALQKIETDISTNESRRKSVAATRADIYLLLESVGDLISKNKDLEALSPQGRVDTFLKLLSFVCPKPVERDQKTDETLSHWLSTIQQVNLALGKH